MDGAEAWSRRFSKAHCQAEFDRCGVPCSPYRTVAEALADPQVAHRQSMGVVTDAGGSFKALNPPFRMSDADTGVAGHAPALGEHTGQVLREAGLSAAAIAALQAHAA